MRGSQGSSIAEVVVDQHNPLLRAITFTNTIKSSKLVDIVRGQTAGEHQASLLPLEVQHVDGTQNSLDRQRKLAWLQTEDTDDRIGCRVPSLRRWWTSSCTPRTTSSGICQDEANAKSRAGWDQGWSPWLSLRFAAARLGNPVRMASKPSSHVSGCPLQDPRSRQGGAICDRVHGSACPVSGADRSRFGPSRVSGRWIPC